MKFLSRSSIRALCCLCLGGACTPEGCDGEPDKEPKPTCMDGQAGDCLADVAAAELPDIPDWTCPTGWSASPAFELTAEEQAAGREPAPSICEPPAAPQDCADGTMAVLGEAACQPVGAPCPAGDWPEDLPSGRDVIYVQTGGSGDGSSTDSPLGTIAAALAQAPDNAVVALAKGTYSELVTLNGPVVLWGACAAETVITSPTEGDDRGTVEMTGSGGGGLHNLKLTGPRVGLWVLQNSDPVEVTGVWVHQARYIGVFFSDDGHGTLSDIRISDTQVDPSDSTYGRGLQVYSGAQLELTRGVIEQSRDIGVVVYDPDTAATLNDVIIRDTLSEVASSMWGIGLEVGYEAKATVNQGLLERNRNSGIVVYADNSELHLTDIVVQDTLPQENNDRFGGAMECAPGALVRITRGLFQRSNRAGLLFRGPIDVELTDVVVRNTEGSQWNDMHGHAVMVYDRADVSVTRGIFAGGRNSELFLTDSRVNLSDVIVRETRVHLADQRYGRGVEINTSATINAQRLLVERTEATAVAVTSSSLANFTDLVIRGTNPQLASQAGRGLFIQSGARVSIDRGHIEGAHQAALFIRNGNTQVDIQDLVIRDMQPWGDYGTGRGINVQDGGRATVVRAELERCREAALFAGEVGSALDVEDVVVRDTLAATSEMGDGRAASVQDGAEMRVVRGVFDQSREVGAYVTDDRSLLELLQVWVVGTQEALAIEFGHGAVARDLGTMVLDDCVVADNANVGVAYSNAHGVVKNSVIRDNPVGIFAGDGSTLVEVEQAPDQAGDLEVAVSNDTAFEGNGTKVGSGQFPVPDLLDLLDE